MKKNYKRKKRPITLIEIMIVILLIGLIGGALAYNMSGSLDEGKSFKTKQNIEKIHDILMIEYAQGQKTLNEVASDWVNVINRSPLVTPNQKTDLLKDGWKKDYRVDVVGDDIEIKSDGLQAYVAKKNNQ